MKMKERLFAVAGWCRRVWRGFMGNNCPIHAAGLTYFSILAFIPVLCCVLVVAKACNIDEMARREINTRIDTLIASVERAQDDDLAKIAVTDQHELARRRIAVEEFAKVARRTSNTIFERISGYDIGTFGWLGFGLLVWMIISSLGMVEISFNQIWGVPKPRPLWKRAYVYLSLLLLLPMTATAAMSLPVINWCKNISVMMFGANAGTKWMSDCLLWLLDSKIVGLAISGFSASLTFTLFFLIIPNCKVGFRSACCGGVATAVLFALWIKVCLVAQVGIARSSMLYGSFAFLPIVLAWMYMSWEIVLLGANMAREFERDEFNRRMLKTAIAG